MRVQFQNDNLKELYQKGASRKYKNVPTQVVLKLVKAVAVLESAICIQDVWNFPGYKIEKLANSERYSMRMNVQWRLELTITWTDENKVSVDVVNLVELSKHYGD
mgnify:FL=1